MDERADSTETMKYGSTIIADPRKPSSIRSPPFKDEGLAEKVNDESKEKFLQWSYIEACTFVKRYGDVLEEVEAY